MTSPPVPTATFTAGRRAAWLGLGLLLALASCVDAGDGALPKVADLSASSFAFAAGPAGPAQAHASLVGLRLESDGAPPASGDGPAFTLGGERVRVEVDGQGYDSSVLLVANGPHKGTTRTDFAAARVDAGPVQADAGLWLLPHGPGPAPTVSWSAGAGRAGQPTAPSVVVAARVDAERQYPQSSTAGAIQVAADAGQPQALDVAGSFVLSLYGWSVNVTDAAGAHPFWSGYRYESVADDPSGATTGVRTNERYQQIFLFVTNGTFHAEAGALGGADLVLGGFRLDGAGALHFDVPSGRLLLPGDAQPVDGAVDLAGDLQVAASSDADAVHAEVFAAGRSLTVDGRVVALPEPAGVRGPGATTWFVALGAATILPGFTFGSRRWMRRRLAALERAEAFGLAGRDDEAADAAGPLVAVRGLRQEATAMKVDALLRAGRTAEARAFVDSITGWSAREQPALDYFRAYVAAHDGDALAAEALLHRCLKVAPAFREEAAREPLLAGLLPTARRPKPRARPEQAGYS